jgi:energy-coupling factor transport system ATP-binding protein
MLLVEHRVAEASDLVERVIVLEAGGGVVADGPPSEVFATRGDELAAAGIWVPNHPLPMPPGRERARPEAVVVAEEVGYRFPGEQSLAVGPMDVAVRSSEALAIVGPNGSGKSTLALLLGGLLRPTTGSVTCLDQTPIWRLPAHRLARFIGSVFQDPEHQFLMGTVREELMLTPPQERASAGEASRKAWDLMERLHLAALAEANPFSLSGGEKRRLSVATALVGEPSVLILDEPTFGQDRRTAVELLDLLARQRDEGAAVCFVTHDLPFAAALADRTLELAR